MTILLFDWKATNPAVPTWATSGQRAQGRSSKAAGLRASGSCLTEPSTLAFSFQSGTPPEPLSATSAVCPIYWWQNRGGSVCLNSVSV
jgi:hypothetical protein